MTIIMKVSFSTIKIIFLLLIITIWSYSSGLERWIWSQCCRTLIKVFCSTTCQRQRMGVNWQTCLLPLTSLHTLLIPLMLLYHVTQVFLHHYASISLSIQKHICYICSCHMLLYTTECDVPVPGIPGTGNFSCFWWYRNRYQKKLVPEKSIGSEPVSEKNGTGKSIGTGTGKNWYW